MIYFNEMYRAKMPMFLLVLFTLFSGVMAKENLSIVSENNEITLNSYELGVNEYVAGTAAEVSGSSKIWMDKTLAPLSKEARIFEIGSAFGRDARYIESLGFTVERSDATEGFIHLLQQEGYSACLFNVLTDDFDGTYDLIFANKVFLHFTPAEFQKVLGKVYASLSPDGILSFSVKHGEGEEWSTVKVSRPRYFCYWRMDTIKSFLESNGFIVLEVTQDEVLHIIAKRNEF